MNLLSYLNCISIALILVFPFFKSDGINLDERYQSKINKIQLNSQIGKIDDIETNRVLLISSYTLGEKCLEQQYDSFIDNLEGRIELSVEFLNTRNIKYDTSRKNYLYEYFNTYLNNSYPFDLIIAGDDDALDFTFTFRDSLFENIPVLFMGINDYNTAYNISTNYDQFTGIFENILYYKTFELAFEVIKNPNAINLIYDDSTTSSLIFKECEKFIETQNYKDKYKINYINSSLLNRNEIIAELNKLKKEDITLFIGLYEDKDGNQYNARSFSNLFGSYVNVPIFVSYDMYIDELFWGGGLYNHYKACNVLSGIINKYFKGDIDLKNVQLITDSFVEKTIGYNLAKKYNLDLSLVDDTTVIINQDNINVLEEYKTTIIIVSVIFFIFILTTVLSLVFIRITRKKNKALNEARLKLQVLSEKDGLTGLDNRTVFEKNLEKILITKIPCSVFMIDIDDFKSINDKAGHLIGDAIIIKVVKC